MLSISHSQNICHQLSRRELGDRISLEGFRDRHLIKNMSKANYTKTILNGHDRLVVAFDVQGYLAATVSFDNTIKLWNLETGKCLWTFDPEPRVRWKERIKIVEGNIVCSGLADTSSPFTYDNTIRMIHLQTGLETAFITDPRLEADKICTIGKQIFCVLNEGNIGEWDLEGRLIRFIHSEKLPGGIMARFLGSGNFLAHIADHTLVIHNLKEESERKIALHVGKEDLRISSAHLDNDRLICGFSNYGRNLPSCCVIDLKNGQMIHRYQITGAFLHTEIDPYSRPYVTESGTIWKIITNKEWAYLGHSTGRIVAVHLTEKTHVVLGQHQTPVHHLAIEGQILISGSSQTTNRPAELKFWDIRSLAKIGEMELSSLCKISFVSGKVFAAVERSFIQWDYLVSHKGEIIAKNSPTEPVMAVRTGDCSIQ